MTKINIEKIQREKPIGELIRFGIINIDKPSGPTSFSVSDYIRKELKINKTSHGGTLDPSVSGVLPILLGRACRLSDYFMHKNKTYVGIMRLHAEVSDDKLNKVIKKFLGKIKQLPPVKSRVKREIREREVASFNILEREGKDVLFGTEVEAGTYIRKICDDMGREIGGAHMLELRRTNAGIFNEGESFGLYEFDEAVNEYHTGKEEKLRKMIIPAEIISKILPVAHIKKQAVKKALSGSPVFDTFLEEESEIKGLIKGEKICIFCGEQFIGCYEFIGKENLIAKPEFVFN